MNGTANALRRLTNRLPSISGSPTLSGPEPKTKTLVIAASEIEQVQASLSLRARVEVAEREINRFYVHDSEI
jgi:hypothetical protein